MPKFHLRLLLVISKLGIIFAMSERPKRQAASDAINRLHGITPRPPESSSEDSSEEYAGEETSESEDNVVSDESTDDETTPGGDDAIREATAGTFTARSGDLWNRSSIPGGRLRQENILRGRRGPSRMAADQCETHIGSLLVRNISYLG